MKKYLFLTCFLFFGLLLNAQDYNINLNQDNTNKCTNSNIDGFNATFSYSNIYGYDINTEKGIFTAIDIDGTYPSGNDGDPQLLVDRKLIAIPIDATPILTIKSYTEEIYNLDEYGMHKIFPRQPSVSKSANLEDVKFIYNKKTYATKGFVGKEIADLEIAGSLRGVNFGFINIRPIVYDATTNTIKVRNNIEIEVKFKGSDKVATQKLFETTYSPYFNSFYSNIFNKDIYDDNPDLLKNPVYMLVIADRMFEDAIQPWLEWKTKKGFYLDVNYKDEIGNEYTDIQQFVANKYNEGIENNKVPTFVVLFGDIGQIPTVLGTNSKKVTDLYFGSIDGDIYPEMYCSRMSCETTSEMESLIEKILVYEQYTMVDPSYLNNALLIAGADAAWNPKVGQPTINYAKQYYFNSDNGYTGVYDYLTEPYTGCYDHLSSGVGHAHYTAHGGNESWQNPYFDVNDVNTLTNNGKYFLAIGNCCIAANYGHSSPCFAEAMIRANKKGAYSYIGSAPSTYWNEDYYWAVGANTTTYGLTPTLEGSSMGAFDAMFMPEAYNTVNSINFAGCLSVSFAHEGEYTTDSNPTYYWEAYNVLGDGSIMPYLSRPTENNINHPAVLYIGNNTFNISADKYSLVALSKDGELIGTGYVDESGVVDIEIEPVTNECNIDIVVTCPQKIPYIAQIPAKVEEGPYLAIDSFTLDGDGILSYGETTNLSLNIKNVGLEPTTTESNISITCDNDKINILNGTSTCGALDVNETETINNFKFSASEDINNGEQFIFNVVISNSEGNWEQKIRIIGYKPILEYDKYEWGGTFTPNSTIDVNVCYKNIGGFKTSNVEVDLNTTNTNVTISPKSMIIPKIGPNGSACATFTLNIGNINDDEDIEFTTTAIGDDGGVNANGEFTLSNSCNIVFKLLDAWGDGWNGDAFLEVIFSDDTPTENLTVPNLGYGIESSEFIKVMSINFGTEITLKYHKGMYDYENTIIVYYENDPDNVIYKNEEEPKPGILHTFICTCGALEVKPITNLNVEVINKNDVKLTWEHPNEEEISSYIIYKDGNEINTTNLLSYIDENVDLGEHNYCVTAVSNNNLQSMQVCEQIEVLGIKDNNNLSIYPNPSNNLVYIDGNIKEVLVYNNIGMLIHKSTENIIDVSKYKAGIYILNIIDNNGKTKNIKLSVY